MRISEILKITGGKLLSGAAGADIDTASISTDSRSIKKGEFFLPLKGNNFNGEDFIDDALKRGAIGTFVTRAQVRKSTSAQEKIIIQVKDTTEALQRIAHIQRMKSGIPVIGVTGSNGKTTVKEMIYGVLSSKFKVLKNEGTKNNHIGVPQTLLNLCQEHDICVLEMGTNHEGEIRTLADIARPNIAVITNIGPSHLEFLKDLDGVYKAKKEIFAFLDRGGTAIINGDDKYLSALRSGKFGIRRYGFGNTCNFRASQVKIEGGKIRFTVNNKPDFTLNLLGVHNIYNALAAIAVASNFGISIESMKNALAKYAPTEMRLNIRNISGITLVDDTYNSNPLSMKCALEAIKDYPAGAKWIVSADMLELGKGEKDFHSNLGEIIANYGFNGLITFGGLSQFTSSRALECGMVKNKIWHCSTREEVADILKNTAKEGDLVLIKGSRAMKMEEVIKKLKD